jgi:hypothetical protein
MQMELDDRGVISKKREKTQEVDSLIGGLKML